MFWLSYQVAKKKKRKDYVNYLFSRMLISTNSKSSVFPKAFTMVSWMPKALAQEKAQFSTTTAISTKAHSYTT